MVSRKEKSSISNQCYLSRVLAIDPGAHAGWSLIEEGGIGVIHGYGILKTDAQVIHKFVVDQFDKAAKTGYGLVAYIEDQYMGVNPKSMAKIVECRARFQQELEARGVQVTLVAPQRWQQGLLGRGLISIKSKRADRKKAAQFYVKSVYGVDATIDEADAICLSIWASKNKVLEDKIESARTTRK